MKQTVYVLKFELHENTFKLQYMKMDYGTFDFYSSHLCFTVTFKYFHAQLLPSFASYTHIYTQYYADWGILMTY